MHEFVESDIQIRDPRDPIRDIFLCPQIFMETNTSVMTSKSPKLKQIQSRSAVTGSVKLQASEYFKSQHLC